MKTRLQVKVMAASLLAVGAAVVLWACQKEKYPDDAIDAQIAKSVEMENYIVAGYELQTALVEFQKELNKVNFSKLEFVPNAEGIMSIQLPIQSLVFEAKLNALNNQKRELHRKFPQLVSFTSERRESIIESCIANSVIVSTKLLDMGINIFQPMTKRMIEPWMDSEDYRFLGNWIAYSGDRYVEVMMIVFADGHTTTYGSPNNTPINAELPTYYRGGNRYFLHDDSSPIRVLIHTHSDRMGVSPDPSALDMGGKFKDVDNVTYGIYYKGDVQYY